jgi:GNAT superfamily N-acetyltransferase
MDSIETVTDVGFEAFYDVYSNALTRSFDAPWLSIEKRVNLTDDAYGTKVALIGRDESGSPVSAGWVVMPLQDNVHTAFVEVLVPPAQRRRGHGTAMLDALLDVARAGGRTQVYSAAAWALDVVGDAGRWFAEARGFEMDILDAIRELALPADLPPLGASDVSIMRSSAYSSTHSSGHTQLAFPQGDEVFQWDTLVRREHRGHGLGLGLKIRAMQASADLLEGRRRVTTYNAASNAHMIAVNERLGFRQTAWAAEYVRPI